MDGTKRPVLARHLTVFTLAGMWLVMGCRQTEHRMSLDEFLDRQEVRAAQRQEAVQQKTAADLDPYLGPYKVGPGDVLAVTLVRPDGDGPAAPIQVRVDRHGDINLPVVGAVNVADKELEDVEDTIRQAYVPGVYQQGVFYVELVSVKRTNVLLVGAVLEPGLVSLRRTERNMLYAIATAGGITDVASGRTTLKRIRRPGEEITLDLTDPLQLQQVVALDPLEDGDIVLVETASPNTIFVGGLVARTGPQMYPTGTDISILQALAAASGLRTDVTPREGTLIRRMPNGADAHVKLDMQRLALGLDPNILLEPGDILWVPETLETKVQDFINRNIFMRAGVSVTYNVTGLEYLNRARQQSARYSGGDLSDSFDPLGFLSRNTALQDLTSRPATP